MEFLKNNKRFSFRIDGRDAWSCPYKVRTEQNGSEIVTRYDFEDGLRVTNRARKYEKYGVYEWVNSIENISEKPSGLLSEFWDCDVELPLSHEEDKAWKAYFPDVATATKICAPTGSTWSTKEFYCDIDEMRGNRRPYHIYPGETKKYKTSGGRSSEAQAPFFNIGKKGEGYIVAIGWTGQWLAEFGRTNDSVTVRTKIEDTHFRLFPGEKIRTSSVMIMPYKESKDLAHNLWRRFVKDELSPIGKERAHGDAPLCAGIWGGMPTGDILERIEKIRENQLPFEYLWIDAGWYGVDTKPTANEFEGDWSAHTGDWQVSPLVHPDGLQDVSEAAHEAGLKLLLWFEPERAVRSSHLYAEHPEWFLRRLKDDGQESSNYLLDLGNDEAWNYCFAMLSEKIEKLRIDCYRQDFNLSPLPHWRQADAEDRKGISEIRHICGLYRLWDRLLERFPHLLIDNCASGGRRIDVETLRRSVPLWRSDAQCPANYDTESVQNHNLAFNLWMPYSGTGSGRLYDEYRIRSAYAAGMTTNYSFSLSETFCDTEEKIRFLRKYTQEYRKVRPYFSEDFYPLTEITGNLDTWCAAQFHRPDQGDGMVEVFRREKSPYETARFELKGMDSAADYLFTDVDGGEFLIPGKELAENGFSVTVKEQRKAKIFLYRIVRK